MKISEVDAAKKVKKKLKDFLFDDEKRTQLLDFVYDKFNMPTGELQGYIGGQYLVEDAGMIKLFMMAYGIDQIKGTHLVDDIFTLAEQSILLKERIEINKAKFPIIFKCLQVRDDQWIGTCTAQDLMRLRESQLINYNKNAQRVLRKVIRNGNAHYKIDLNESSVSAIKESFERDIYIPDVITLNIPESENDFFYNSDKSELIIRSIERFDMADGFHRYSALCRIYDVNKDFDYPMELQILHYPDDRVRQFIFQQDQKNRMRKIDSESMNMNDPVNRVVERLNTDSKCLLAGCISRNEGLVNYAELAQCVDYFFYKADPRYKSKSQGVQFMLTAEPLIRDKLNKVIEANPKLIEGTIDFKTLMMIFYCITSYEDDACEHVATALEQIDQLDSTVFATKRPRKGMLKYIKEICE